MIKAAIFDLDGTLFDRDTGMRRLVGAQYAAYAAALAHVAKPAFVTRFLVLEEAGVRAELQGLIAARGGLHTLHGCLAFRPPLTLVLPVESASSSP